uniref:Tc1-like transposase DDE domain-containing protein n=1 Tax=Oncorhynchus tshawytscha TaxID=74940 RepID=A0AAZ3S1A8_ONCTS
MGRVIIAPGYGRSLWTEDPAAVDWAHRVGNITMAQHTSRLCKGYLTKKESDGVLHQMTWPPQSPDLNPIEMDGDELDRRVKEKQPTSAQHMWELIQDSWKSI